jgi:ubiquinone/menaquinone biosynthesis C-methylase UbiE
MKVSRKTSVRIQYVLDQWVPPRLRDSRLLMYLPMKLVLKDATRDFMTFKHTVFDMTAEEFSHLYERTAHVQELQGETDLNEACTDEILGLLSGKSVLEVGCGRGYLARRLAEANTVTACDIQICERLTGDGSDVRYVACNVENLPFGDASFDYVVSTHTLEHVQDLPRAMRELRRVAREGLIVVVPKQRPYEYTFSLHTQFFPYEWSLRGALGGDDSVTIRYLGDWFYHQRFDTLVASDTGTPGGSATT